MPLWRESRGFFKSFCAPHFTFLGSSLSQVFFPVLSNCGSASAFKLLGLKDFEVPILQCVPAQVLSGTGGGAANSVETDIRRTLLDQLGRGKSATNSLLRSFSSIPSGNIQEKIVRSQNLKNLVKVFVIHVETTGFCRERGRIIEIAIRDLSGGRNSCFQTLVNPEQGVPNSSFHGITSKMVNHPHVPRMKDLIPILVQYIRSRLIRGGIPLFVAHNGRCFDFPFIIREFRRCSLEIPSSWHFLDTLPLARALMRSNGTKLSSTSLQAICEFYGIQGEGSDHRAMKDVNSLALSLEKLTFDLKLTASDLLRRSANASDMVNLKKKKKRKKKEKTTAIKS